MGVHTRNKVWIISILGLLLLNLLVPLPPTKAIWNTQSTSWFEDQYLNVRKFIWTYFNATSFSMQYSFNTTSAEHDYLQDRWTLSLYTLLSFLAYEKTGNNDYLIEAEFFLDGLSTRETSRHSLQIYPLLNWTVSDGIFYGDAPYQWAKAIQSQLGRSSYNATTWITQIKAAAGCQTNNSTDLGWNAQWTEPGAPAVYTIDDWNMLIAYMAWLTNQKIVNCTADLTRLYHFTERGRKGDNLYAYNVGDGSSNIVYTALTAFGLLAGKYWTPSIFNAAKLQQTMLALNSSNLSDLGVNPYAIAADNMIASKISGFGETYFGRMAETFFAESFNTTMNTMQGYEVTPSKRQFLQNIQFLTILGFLNFNYSTINSVNFSKAYYLTDYPGYFYLYTQFNPAYPPAFPYTRMVPDPYYVDVVLDDYGTWHFPITSSSAYPSHSVTYNGTHYSMYATVAGGGTYKENVTKYGFYSGFSFQTDTVKTYEFTSSYGASNWVMLLPDGTTRALSTFHTRTWSGLSSFTLNLVISNVIYEAVLVHSPISTTWQQTYKGGTLNLWTSTTYFKSALLESPWGAANDNSYRRYLLNALGNFTTYSGTYTWQKHWTDAILTSRLSPYYQNIAGLGSIYSYNASGSLSAVSYSGTQLKFTVTAPSGRTSITKIYVGTKGQPIGVSGAGSWSYDPASGMLTISALDSSPAQIQIFWKLLGDINGDNRVDATDLHLLAAAYGTHFGDPNYSSNSDINSDGNIDANDLRILAENYGKH